MNDARAEAREQGRAGGTGRYRDTLVLEEKVQRLLDPGTPVEIGKAARSQHPGLADTTPRDGTFTGWGNVAGHEVAIVAEDPVVLSRTDGQVARRKRNHLLRMARYLGKPIILLIAGSPEPVAPFDLDAGELGGKMSDPREDVDLAARSALMVSAVLGAVAGWARDAVAASDVVIAGASAFEGLSAAARSSVDVVAGGEGAALDMARFITGLLLDRGYDECRLRFGSGTTAEPEDIEVDGAPVSDTEGAEVDGALVSDPVRALEFVVDTGSLQEFRRPESSGLCTGLARIGGWPVVVAATGGPESAVLERDDLTRLRRVWRLSGSLTLPLVILEDCAGLSEEADQDLESFGALVSEIRRSDSPVITVFTGRGHSLGTFPLGTRQLGAAFLVAWPWAKLPVSDPTSYSAGALEAAREQSPWLAAGRGLIDDVLTPAETVRTVRQMIALFSEHWRPAGQSERPNDGPDSGIG